MKITLFFKPLLSLLLLLLLFSSATVCANSKHYVRYSYEGDVRYGELINENIHGLTEGLFPLSQANGSIIPLESVKLLPPTKAEKVFAVGMNFSSHASSPTDSPPPLFLKLPTSLTGHNAVVTVPIDADNVHFEGELVIVIGKQAKNVSIADAPEHIFGVTIGNDLTERSWQGQDLQWLRAKATDGFGPVGPSIATGIDYNNVLLTVSVNGKIIQQENTSRMIHKPAKVVSYLSQYVTLKPGDLIFMGTVGKTRALESGEVVSIAIEGVGTLVNKVIK